MRHMLSKSCPRILRIHMKPLFSSIVMGAGAWMSAGLLTHWLSSAALACLGGIAVGGVIYLIMILALRIITLEDCLLLPKGEKIARLLRIK